jgi:uncharacterized protein YndB with AHSA1/START domain
MEPEKKTKITVKASIMVSIENVWRCCTTPEDIEKWYHASDDWQTPRAENDLRIGGKFLYRMEAKDGSFGFDFEGVFENIVVNKQINYTIVDGRKVKITFTEIGNNTNIIEEFEAETLNSIDVQRAGWQAILNNFKNFTEAKV